MARSERDKALDEMLRSELLSQRKPRGKSKVRATDTVLKRATGKDSDGASRIAAQG